MGTGWHQAEHDAFGLTLPADRTSASTCSSSRWPTSPATGRETGPAPVGLAADPRRPGQAPRRGARSRARRRVQPPLPARPTQVRERRAAAGRPPHSEHDDRLHHRHDAGAGGRAPRQITDRMGFGGLADLADRHARRDRRADPDARAGGHRAHHAPAPAAHRRRRAAAGRRGGAAARAETPPDPGLPRRRRRAPAARQPVRALVRPRRRHQRRLALAGRHRHAGCSSPRCWRSRSRWSRPQGRARGARSPSTSSPLRWA